MRYHIDVLKIIDNQVKIEGWVLPKSKNKIPQISIKEENRDINAKIVKTKRDDVSKIYFKKDDDIDLGFNIAFDFDENKNYFLWINVDKKTIKEKINKKIIISFNSFSKKRIKNFLGFLKFKKFLDAINYLKENGFSAFIRKVDYSLKGMNVDYDYDEWYRLTKPTKEELDRQKTEIFSKRPLLSLIVPIYDTDRRFLKKFVESVLSQTYENFELCIADATDYKNSRNNPKEYLEKIKDTDDRIKIKYLDNNKSISTNTNEALSIAKGDYIVLCDHDDELTYDALYKFVKVINKYNSLFIYSDEDKIDTADSSYFEPHFKSDFNLDMLLSVNYICHLCCIDKNLINKLVDEYGSFERVGFNGAQDYDLYLRIVAILIRDNDLDKIYHIRKVLYHWRSHDLSTSKISDSKKYAFENGKIALKSFYEDKNVLEKINFSKVDDVVSGFKPGIYHTIYEKIENEPKVTIVIPNKDHISDLENCIKSLNKSIYKNLKILIVENNSVNKETFKYYENIKSKTDYEIEVFYYKDKFNYSKINNFAVNYIDSEYILFLNNDVEMIDERSIEEMMDYIIRDDVGAVGAKLLYKDGTIQHAGVVLGIGGIADHAFKGIDDKLTYMNRATYVQDYSAITGACFLTKKTVFNSVGGFDELLGVAFNDIDLCMKIREKNLLIVYNPYASFYHYESKSRGLEDSKEKVDRFNIEFARFLKKWNSEIIKGDIYYNPNLTLRKNDFSIKNLKFEKINEPYKIDDEINKIMENLK